jgi:hypothetical protein
MSGASTIIHKQSKYIKLFNKIGAINEEHSIKLDEIGIRKSYLFNRMIYRGIFIECENGKFYIDNESALRFKTNMRIKGLAALIIALVLASIIILLESNKTCWIFLYNT